MKLQTMQIKTMESLFEYIMPIDPIVLQERTLRYKEQERKEQ